MGYLKIDHKMLHLFTLTKHTLSLSLCVCVYKGWTPHVLVSGSKFGLALSQNAAT